MANEKEQRLVQQEAAQKKMVEDAIAQNKAAPAKNASNDTVPTPARVDDPHQEKQSNKLSISSSPALDTTHDHTSAAKNPKDNAQPISSKGSSDAPVPMSSGSNLAGDRAAESSTTVDKPKKRTKKSRWDSNSMQPPASPAPPPPKAFPADASSDSAQSRKRKRKKRWSQPASDDAQLESTPPFKRHGPLIPTKPRPDFQPPNRRVRCCASHVFSDLMTSTRSVALHLKHLMPLG